MQRRLVFIAISDITYSVFDLLIIWYAISAVYIVISFIRIGDITKGNVNKLTLI